MKKLIHSEPIAIDSGDTGGSFRFTPQTGKVIGFSIYHNNDDGSINDGLVNARLATDAGEDIAPMTDIRHYRNRNASYRDGLVELDLDTEGRTLVLTIAATDAFSADFKGTLVLVYEKDNQYC